MAEAPTAQNASAGGESAGGDAKEQAQAAAGNAASKAQDAVRTQVDERSSQAGEQATSMASDLRSVSEQLRSQENERAANLAEKAANKAEEMGGYLKDANADRILGDVEDLGRRQPWLALAGGVALGVVAARFLKASSSQRYQANVSNQGLSTPYSERTLAPRTTTATPPATQRRPGITDPVSAPVEAPSSALRT